jgi:glutamate-ammonia-ligase adenylyltransferase
MSLFTLFFAPYVPVTLLQESERIALKLVDALSEQQAQRLQTQLETTPLLAQQLTRALVGSDYIMECCCRDPDILFHWLLVDVPFSPLTPVKIIDAVETACSDQLSLTELDSLLRRLRRRFMTGLYWRDLNGLADFNEVSHAMTAMAEVFVQQALNFHYRELSAKHGLPIGKDSGQVQPLLVVGMGKLGGGELNVSSDIDLIFAFPEAGKTNHKIGIDNQQFFSQLGQRLIKSLDEITVDGFVFRVDMRLRPYGESGALASNFNALENYYQTQGRDWERFAAIKARVIACSIVENSEQSFLLEQQATENFYSILRPFIYRKYIDFSMIESLRQLKVMIVQEVRRKGLQDDVKLGAGGIREIEFIVQSFQLIRGGCDKRLQERHLLTVLQRLVELQHVTDLVAKDLRNAYLFLRKTEHSLQAYQDKQTQRLPVDPLDCERLAWVMGFAQWPDFLEALQQQRAFVSAEFNDLIAESRIQKAVALSVEPEWQALWLQPESAVSVLSASNFIEAEQLVAKLIEFQQSRNVLSLSATAREKLDLFMPNLLQALAELSEPDLALIRTLDWLEAIVTRTSYLLLLLENPQVLKHLVTLFGASSWVTQTLTQTPALLDELLHPESLYRLPEKNLLQDDLRQRLLRLEPDDIEAHMEALRYFRLAHNLHVAACEVAGSLPLMKVSDYLTFTAEVILEQVLQLAWRELSVRHGCPAGTSVDNPRFIIVGYGKLGGIEMSYSSDLDLVFIYDAEPQAMTNGSKPLDNQTFYTRLGQKIIQTLNTRTLSGQLYEVDMRLRPSGNSGLLVSSMTAYARYQQQDAWVWEHQALVRARPVAGDTTLAAQFIALRKTVLGQTRAIPELKKAVVEMREKMRLHLGTAPKQREDAADGQLFHLKQDAGGIVDIEFMVQYAVLAWAHKQATLCEWTDNIRLLECLRDSDFIDASQANQLIEIYQSYRSHTHRLALQQNASAAIEADCFVDERKQVKALWDYFLS